MSKIRTNVLLNICIVIGLLLLFYYAFLTHDTINQRNLKKNARKDIKHVKFLPPSLKKRREYNVWLIFTKVTKISTLSFKFRDLIHNLLNVTSVPLKFNIIVDKISQRIAENQISDVVLYMNKSVVYSFYDIEESAKKIQDIVQVMTPYFSSKPGTYYSDALFYISLGLYRIAPQSQDIAVLLDCDLYFKKDVALLFKEFDKFKSTALFGLAPELTPVYRHILHMYKAKHNTTFGDYYHQQNISNATHPRGFQGYNSGVVLIRLKAQRNSTEFLKVINNSSVLEMTSKYKFRGHLGDQDFYTLLGYEYPHLIQTLNCGFNRQLCTWWRDHGYSDIFDHYAKCDHDTVVLHGNCNTRIPK
ncbi:hypothetical protein NQ315_005573 [Exocentrus adspersus]|uniref:Xyloside xylosyltransferase 1 n=1 Tax=Exocentrus adspersus TaxID=1586481 RepID=A0AAV8VTQ1_9CUCU|nr:hypothetical protein NQ315_005573 [Exocentrus adspersus]